MIITKKELRRTLGTLTRMADTEITKLKKQMPNASDEAKLQLQSTINEIKQERERILMQARRMVAVPDNEWRHDVADADRLVQNAEAKVLHLAKSARKLFY